MKKLAGIAVLVLAVGCVGEVPPQPDPDDPIPGADAGNDPTPAALTGTVADYETGAPLANAVVSTEGLTPELTATTDAAGLYTIADVPTDQVVGLMVTAEGAYRITHNSRVLTTGVTQTANLFAVAEGYIGRSQNSLVPPVEITLDTAYVMAHLVKGDGTARDGVAIGDVLALDQAVPPAPVGDGVFFIDGLGNASAIATSTPIPSKNGMTTIVALNVPPGPLTVQATYPADGDGGNGGGNQIKSLLLTVTANHAYLVTVNNKPVEDFLALGGGGGGGGDGGGGGGGDGTGGGGGGN